MKKILLVFGTRPEAIKMAPLVKELENYRDLFDSKVCITAQHREMLDQVLEIFGITPDYDLNIMKQGQDLYDITSSVLIGMREILNSFQPDLVLVHGDTTTSSSAALASFYQRISVGHVEAGLRTGNIYSPWPEEMNRLITGRIAKYHFSPTESTKKNLIKENIKNEQIVVTGNTVIDALLIALKKIEDNKELRISIQHRIQDYGYKNINELVNQKRQSILITGHRRENFGDGFISICEAIKELAFRNFNFDFIYPVHLNPNVQEPVFKILGNIPNVFLLKPLDYLPFIYLMKHSFVVLTDSGGIQEEAPGLGKPVIVMRDTTERPEAVKAGTVKLVGTNKELIVSEINRLITDQDYYLIMSKSHNPYGDGTACSKIIDFLKENLI